MCFPILNSGRLCLRRVEADSPVDVEAMYRCYQCPDVHRYTDGRAFRKEEWPDIIRGWEEERKQGRFIRWGISRKPNDELIGGIYLYPKSQNIYVGYLLHPACWGKGLASEALATVKNYVFTQGKADTLYASVDRRNAASIRLLEQAGFHRLKSKGKEFIYAQSHPVINKDSK